MFPLSLLLLSLVLWGGAIYGTIYPIWFLSIMLFIFVAIYLTKLLLNKEHDLVIVASFFAVGSVFIGNWVYGVWTENHYPLQPIIVSRIFLILATFVGAALLFMYGAALISYRRTRGNIEKERLVAKTKENWLNKLKFLSNREKQEELTLVLGEAVPEKTEKDLKIAE
ncbi:hypothetical protein [Thermicanus aegyptius]|uniref:hypothetical protein n=1 Tax=Thermicanus aegyptius TaxID=94009 RepID=UPI000423C891|nr:hypothetical protein [Thermicanus aegyptius]